MQPSLPLLVDTAETELVTIAPEIVLPEIEPTQNEVLELPVLSTAPELSEIPVTEPVPNDTKVETPVTETVTKETATATVVKEKAPKKESPKKQPSKKETAVTPIPNTSKNAPSRRVIMKWFNTGVADGQGCSYLSRAEDGTLTADDIMTFMPKSVTRDVVQQVLAELKT